MIRAFFRTASTLCNAPLFFSVSSCDLLCLLLSAMRAFITNTFHTALFLSTAVDEQCSFAALMTFATDEINVVRRFLQFASLFQRISGRQGEIKVSAPTPCVTDESRSGCRAAWFAFSIRKYNNFQPTLYTYAWIFLRNKLIHSCAFLNS